MPELITEQLVKKTRKPHRCHGCMEIIPVGSEALVNTCTDGGEIYTLYFCKSCTDWLKGQCRGCKECRPWGEGLCEGDIKTCKQRRDVG